MKENNKIESFICFIGAIPLSLQFAFQSLCIVAEKPKLGFYITVLAGITNIFLDMLFVGILKFGLPGAAYATIIGCAVGGFIPLVYFIFVFIKTWENKMVWQRSYQSGDQWFL